MKEKAGKILGFITRFTGFLLLFKFLALPKITKEDELAPGIVLIIAFGNGILAAFVSTAIQNYFIKKNCSKAAAACNFNHKN